MHTRQNSLNPYAALLVGGAAFFSSPCLAQSTDPAVFIANNGNLEGSVTSMRLEPDGSLAFVDRVVTGSRSSTSQPCPGCNAYAIDISPSGRFLATSHAAGDAADENVTVYEVGPDASLSVVDTVSLAQGGLDLAWVRDDLLAVCVTNFGAGNELRLYAWDESMMRLTLRDADSAGGFLTSVSVHPSGRWVACNDSSGSAVRIFEIDADQATLASTTGVGVLGVAIAFSPSGEHLYAAGGISAGGHAFAGFAFDDTDGSLAALPGSPFTSPGTSPKGFAFTPDGALMFVSHGTDATIRSFAVDSDGIPASLGASFDVGLQGSLQGIDAIDGRLFATDNTTAIDGVSGAYSLDVDQSTGVLSPVGGAPVPTQGISPNDVVAWVAPGGCPADLNSDGNLDFFDVSVFLGAFSAQDPLADFTGDGLYDFFDVSAFLGAFNVGCP